MIDLSVVQQEVANAITARVRQAFEQQQDPITHRNWSPLKRQTLRYKPAHKPILEKSGLMRSSVRADIVGNSVQVRVSVPQAPFHQFGTQHIPQRRFLPFDDQGKPSPELKADIDHILSPQGRGGQDLARQVANFIFGGVRRRS